MGILLHTPDTNYINQYVGQVYSRETDEETPIIVDIQKGKEFTFTSPNEENGELTYLTFAPLYFGESATPWSVGIAVPVKVIMADLRRNILITLTASILGLVFLGLIIWIISNNITRPLEKTTRLLMDLAEGRVDKKNKLEVESEDEIGTMTRSANRLIDGLSQTADFARKIGEGDLKADYSLLSEDDHLGLSLVEMRDKLKKSRDEIEEQANQLQEFNRELQKLSLVASETDNAVIIMDREGNFEWVNEGFRKMYDYSLEDYVRRYGKNLHEASLLEDIDEKMNECVSQGRSVSYISHLETRHGDKRWFQTTLSPILNTEGDVDRIVAIDSDISKLKKAEEEIALQRDNLAMLNGAKDKFFSIISHDLRNPFSALLSITETMAENFDSFDDREKNLAIKQIKNTVELLFNLLQNLLKWSLSQTGKLKYEPEKLELENLVNSSISVLKLVADKKQIKIVTRFDKKCMVRADKEMVETVMRNLLTNAVKFNKPGGEIHVTSEARDNFIEISVKDTGIGIEKEDIGKLFRIDTKYKRIGTSKERGTGLGLILSKEFIEKHGGEIGVESEPEKGSRFFFTLPTN